jgi:hypothetical protein
VGLFDRLNELTRVRNDFEDEIDRQGVKTPRERRNAPAAKARHVDQLNEDRRRVNDARSDEIGRLLKAGHTREEISIHLDLTDRNRNR